MRAAPTALVTVVLVVLAAACGSPGTKAAVGTEPPPPGPRTENVSLADVGLEATSLDRSVDPCVDFFEYSCGGWLAANEIPADKARYARFTELSDKNDLAVRALLEEAVAAGDADPIQRTLGDFFASCLDEAAVEKRGPSMYMMSSAGIMHTTDR